MHEKTRYAKVERIWGAFLLPPGWRMVNIQIFGKKCKILEISGSQLNPKICCGWKQYCSAKALGHVDVEIFVMSQGFVPTL